MIENEIYADILKNLQKFEKKKSLQFTYFSLQYPPHSPAMS